MQNKRIFLYSSHGCESAIRIAKELPNAQLLTRPDDEAKFVLSANDQSDKERVAANTVLRDSVVIRWGTQLPLAMDNCIVYNKAGCIRNASDKKRARKMLHDAGISIPKFITKGNFKEEDLPIVARPSHHSKCKNIIILRTLEDFLEHFAIYEPKGWYYSKIIDKEHEYRFHCAHGKILAIQEKPRPKNKTTFGWGYAVIEQADWRVLMWDEYNDKWCREVLKAMDVLGLDFGAVDVISLGDKMYILEINTAGCLTESKILKSKYSKYFNWLFESKEKRKHFEYDTFKQTTSLAWNEKNFQ